MDFDVNTQNLKCYNDSSGKATVIVNAGIFPFSFLWSNGQTGNISSDLSAGIYSVSIEDGIGCTFSKMISITEPSLLTSEMNSYPTSADSICNGQGVVNVSGGTPPYIFIWSDGTTWTSGTTSGSYLCPGNYFVTITDSGNCSIIDSVSIFITSLIEEKSLLNPEIYPNPFSDCFTIEFAFPLKEKTEVRVMNLTGSAVISKTILQMENKINIYGNELPGKGVYFLEIICNEKIWMKKLIKNED